ncbi:hypothetical protein BC937DRAFT_92122 [Endogone sp. FLAS-F59071]|nr:hypothetical protein BC937DRAFT_92122 [Endogone sp. FLAS-F59071]|eukprot:RUS15692.1 hypothetical protein BC937DRAFT_92122 [Endogone sp. FLAS-F59071]
MFAKLAFAESAFAELAFADLAFADLAFADLAFADLVFADPAFAEIARCKSNSRTDNRSCFVPVDRPASSVRNSLLLPICPASGARTATAVPNTNLDAAAKSAHEEIYMSDTANNNRQGNDKAWVLCLRGFCRKVVGTRT